MRLKGHVRKKITLVEAIEVDLEYAADVRLVIWMRVELLSVDLDCPVIARRIR